MTVKSAQFAFVVLTVLFLASGMVLLLKGIYAPIAVFMLLVALLGFLFFIGMLMADAGMVKPKDETPPV